MTENERKRLAIVQARGCFFPAGRDMARTMAEINARRAVQVSVSKPMHDDPSRLAMFFQFLALLLLLIGGMFFGCYFQ